MKNSPGDIAAIRETLEKYYLNGLYEGDIKSLKDAFNPGTLLFGDVKGEPYAKTLTEYLDGVSKRVSPKHSGKDFDGEIGEIRVINSIAIAEVKIRMYDFYYQDLLSMHKIDGMWKIVNKMLTDMSS